MISHCFLVDSKGLIGAEAVALRLRSYLDGDYVAVGVWSCSPS